MAISLPLAVLAAAILIFINEASFRKSTEAAASTAKGRLMAILGIANGFTANSVLVLR